MKKFSAIETVEDFQQVVSHATQKEKEDVLFVILSLEALAYAQRQTTILYVHIWDLLDMNAVLVRAFDRSKDLTEAWIQSFSSQNDLYEKSAQYHIDTDFFGHVCSMMEVATQLSTYAQAKKWTYVAPPLHFKFFDFNYAKAGGSQQHFLFQSILIHSLKRHGINVQFEKKNDAVTFRISSALMPIHLTKTVMLDLWFYLLDKFLRRPTIQNLLRQIDKPVDVLMTGWGRDHIKILNYQALREYVIDKKNLSFLHIIWRKKKLPEDWMHATDKWKSIWVRERIYKNESLPCFSMLPFRSLIRFITSFCFGTFRKRMHATKACQPSLQELFSFQMIRANFLFLLYRWHRDAFVNEEITRSILQKSQATFLVGSDSGGIPARIELLVGNACNAITLSTPHGLQFYSVPAYNFLADYIFTPTETTGRLVQESGIKKERIVPIGNHPTETVPHDRQVKQIVIATRSRGGQWSNISSEQNTYHRELKTLLKLLTTDHIRVIIKSHPNGDYHTYYDLLVDAFPLVQHDKKGWTFDRLQNESDVLVFLGEMPSFFFQTLNSCIPVVFLESVMSQVLKQMSPAHTDRTLTVSSAEQAYREIKKILSDMTYRQVVLEAQHARKEHEDESTNPEKNLVEFIEQLA